jgi:hypothetical protein
LEGVTRDRYVFGAMLLGQQGHGWQQVTVELAFERSGPERFMSTFPLLAEFARRVRVTQEHRLHHLSRRCWSWRDEAGSELEWSRVLGTGLAVHDAEGLWPALTRVV